MFGDHFYHERIRKAVAVFGSLFNNIKVVRKDASGNTLSQIKVPLSYSPKRDFLARIDAMQNGEDVERQIALKLPRMGFEILAMSYDPTRQMPKMNNCVAYPSSFDGTGSKLYSPVPYTVSFQLNVFAKSQDDALQIVEQILPYFTPHYTVGVKPLAGFSGVVEDTPITLTGITFSDDYEAPLENRRTIIYTLDFDMRISLYKDIATGAKIIDEAKINLYRFDSANSSVKELYSLVLADSAFKASSSTLAATEDTTSSNISFTVTNLPDSATSFGVSTPTHGTASISLTKSLKTINGVIEATGRYTYIPDSDYSGPDAFNITVNGGFGSKSFPITVDVASVVDAIADAVTVNRNDTTSITVSGNDLWTGDVVYSVAAGGQPSNGSVVVSNASTGVFNYTPDSDYTGADSFVYRGTPTNGTSEVATVSITVI